MTSRTQWLGVIVWAALLAPAMATEPAAPVKSAAPASAPLISQADLLARLESKDSEVTVLDVRTPDEFAAGHLPGARNVPHDQLAARLSEVAASKEKPVVLYCRSGRRAALAAETLRNAGFTKLLHLEGDYQGWEAAQRPIER